MIMAMVRLKSFLNVACAMSIAAMILTGCGSEADAKSSATSDVKTDAQAEETESSETEGSNEAEDAAEDEVTEEMLSIADISGVWELPDITPAGDPCVYQLSIGDDNSISFAQYLADDGKWNQRFIYEGSIESADMESEIMSEGRGDVILDEGFSGYTYVNLDMACVNEYGMLTDYIKGVDLVKKGVDSIEIVLIDGVSLMPDHFYEPVDFSLVTDALADGTVIGSKDDKGAYYDWFIEISDAGWRDAYLEKIVDIRTGNFDMDIPYFNYETFDGQYTDVTAEFMGDSYYLYDIDKDEIPELIVKLGRSEASYWGLLYKYQDYQAQYVDGFGLGHSMLYSDPKENGMIIQRAHMGINNIERAFITNNGIDFEGIYSEQDIKTSDDYMDPGNVVDGAVALPYCDMNDNELIFEYRNMEK